MTATYAHREPVLAGNIARITVTLPALDGHGPLAGTTAEACVTDPAGDSTTLTPDVAVGDDTVTVEVDWEIGDDETAGWYTVTVDTSGPLIAAVETRIRVQARTVPDVP